MKILRSQGIAKRFRSKSGDAFENPSKFGKPPFGKFRKGKDAKRNRSERALSRKKPVRGSIQHKSINDSEGKAEGPARSHKRRTPALEEEGNQGTPLESKKVTAGKLNRQRIEREAGPPQPKLRREYQGNNPGAKPQCHV